MNHYAGQNFAACFPNFAIGGVMRLDVDPQAFDPDVFARDIAVMTETEVNKVQIITTHIGSTVVYFVLKDPTISDLSSDSSSLRRLSGNERMLQLYTWWVTDNSLIDELSYPILDYKVYARQGPSAAEGDSDFVVTLFAPSSPMPKGILPSRVIYNPDFRIISGGQTAIDPATIVLSLVVNGRAAATSSSLVLIIASALLACLLSFLAF